tara:strand:+ start:15257 stop:16405 length:1149 start_codon:yes stop_codon:yes gene_type:complete
MKDYPFRFSITHQTEDNSGTLRFTCHQPEATTAGIRRAARAIDSFHHVQRRREQLNRKADEQDLWTAIVAKELLPAIDLIRASDEKKLAEYLASFGFEYMWFGGLSTGLDGFNHWNREEAVATRTYFDHLLNLAVSLGVLPAELPNPGLRGNWERNVAYKPADVAAKIEAELGISIAPQQNVISVTGLLTENGIVHYRHINALYAALRVKELVSAPAPVCEYGGGLGFVAYYLWQFGYRDLTLVDLPVTNVFSGNLLMGLLGEDAVSLEGEPERVDQIKIRSSYFADAQLAGKRFELSLNQDSFPEIDQAVVDAYLDLIHSTTRRYFLSINHEVEHEISNTVSHLSVPKLMRGRASQYERISRVPNWIRRGYVEEVYRLIHG